MSVKIRLTKTGKKNQIQYRIVVQDTRTKRDGKFLENLGNFNPHDDKKVTINKTEYEAWIKKGAKPTPSLSYLLEFGMLPKKAKKVKVEAQTSDQKPQETNQENIEAPKAEETKQPEAEAPKAEPQPEEEKASSDTDNNPKADGTEEEIKAQNT